MLFVLLYTCVHYFPSMFDEQFPVYSIYLNFSADFMRYKQMFEFDSFCNRTIIIVTAHTITGVS